MHWEKKIGVIVWYILMLPFGVYYLYKLVEVRIKKEMEPWVSLPCLETIASL